MFVFYMETRGDPLRTLSSLTLNTRGGIIILYKEIFHG